MRKFGRVLALLCVVAMTILPLQAFAAAPSAYESEGRNLAVIANGDVNIYGDSMLIEGSVYSNGTIYAGDGQGNKIDGIFISGTGDTTFGSDDNNDEWTQYRVAEGYVHVNDNGTTDGINYYSTAPEYNGAIYDANTSFECSYEPFTVPSIANDLGDVTMTVYYNDDYSKGYNVFDENNNWIGYVPGTDGTEPKTITEDTHIGTLTMDGSQDNWRGLDSAMIIDTTAGDVNVVIDNLNATNPSIKVVGDNKANIYILNVGESTLNNLALNYNTNNYDDNWQISPVLNGITGATHLYLVGDSIALQGNYISAADITVNANSLTVSSSSKVHADINSGAKNFAITGGTSEVYGTVCVPNADSKVVDSGTLYGQLHTNTLTINGAGRIIYKPDTIPVPEEEEPVVTPEPEVDEGEPAYIVRYVVATGEYSRGTMDTKMHKPARGLDAEGNLEEELEYEVLDETTYEITGPQYVSDEIKERVQLILNTTDDVFVQRGSEGLIEPSRFGRIDFNGQDMSLSITPYAYPKMKDKIDTMYLCWGDRTSQVETVWYVIPEELR